MARPLMHLLPLVALIATSCGSDPDSRPSSTEQAFNESERSIVHAEESWRTSVDLLLSQIGEIAVDSQGRVYVADRDAGIVLLSSTGDSLRAIGRTGQGPGEYEIVVSLQVFDGDSLLVFDGPSRRISVFEPDSGHFAYSHTLNALPEFEWPRWVAHVDDPEAPYLAAFAPSIDPRTHERGTHWILRLLDTTGEVVRDSVLVYPAARELFATRESGGLLRATFVMTHPFAPEPVVRLSDNRIYFAHSDSFGVTVYDLEGNRVGGFSVPAKRMPITEQHVERWIESMREQATENSDFEYATKQWIDQVQEDVPEMWPVFQTFLVDDRSRIWVLPKVQASGPLIAGSLEGGPAWDVFDLDGQLIGRVKFTVPLIVTVTGGRAYGVTYDEMGVPTVVASRIPFR